MSKNRGIKAFLKASFQIALKKLLGVAILGLSLPSLPQAYRRFAMYKNCM